MNPKTVYRIKVTLDDSRPSIWRRLLVANTTTLGELHHILQIAVGWTDSHLHMFMLGEQIFGDPDDDETGEIGTKNEKRVRLNQIVNAKASSYATSTISATAGTIPCWMEVPLLGRRSPKLICAPEKAPPWLQFRALSISW